MDALMQVQKTKFKVEKRINLCGELFQTNDEVGDHRARQKPAI